MYDNTYQNNAGWEMDRLFHFTSSEVHKLLTKPKSGDGISKTAESYVFVKLAEVLTNGSSRDFQQVDTKQMKWGHHWEGEARYLYEKRTGARVDLVGFIEMDEYFGGSPDGLVGDDGGIEIKCPYTSETHARYLMMEEPKDLLNLKPEYYAQIQANMLVTGREWFDFVSFDPRMAQDKTRLFVLRIPRDEGYIERIKEALKAAVDALQKYEKKILSII